MSNPKPDSAPASPSSSTLPSIKASEAEVEYSTSWPSPSRPISKCKVSKEHNAAMREIIKPWGSLSSTPPQCRTVSFSSWTKFTPRPASRKSKEDLLASVLWAPKGTSPDYSPPPTEWAYLGVEQLVVAGNSKMHHLHPKIRANSASFWATKSSSGDVQRSEGITFDRVSVRTVSKSSLLTESLRSSSRAGLQQNESALEVLTRELRTRRLSASMLPSAFDSDSEDEEDDDE